MASFRNDTKGARAIHLTGGGHVLVEPGDTLTLSDARVLRVAPGLVATTDPDLPPPPPDLKEAVSSLDHDGDGKPGGSKKGAASTRAKGAAKKRTARKPASKR